MAERSYKSNLIQKRKRPVFMGKYVKAGFPLCRGCFLNIFCRKQMAKNLCGVISGEKEGIALLLKEIYG